ncbi:MAG: hypothetical protein L0958_05240 [Candidatus Mariimomonas ferrooxydans]
MSKIFFIPLILILILPYQLNSETEPKDIEKAEELGEEFQMQMPWSREKSQSGSHYDISQPEAYRATPEKELPASEEKTLYPYCYNPYTYRYELCYYRYYYDDYYRLRLHLPKFNFSLEHERGCQDGFYFKTGWGCYKD